MLQQCLKGKACNEQVHSSTLDGRSSSHSHTIVECNKRFWSTVPTENSRLNTRTPSSVTMIVVEYFVYDVIPKRGQIFTATALAYHPAPCINGLLGDIIWHFQVHGHVVTIYSPGNSLAVTQSKTTNFCTSARRIFVNFVNFTKLQKIHLSPTAFSFWSYGRAHSLRKLVFANQEKCNLRTDWSHRKIFRFTVDTKTSICEPGKMQFTNWLVA